MTRLRSTVIALGLTLALLGASGCSGSAELTTERGRTLQASVLEVTQAAAQGHWREAATLLAATRALLDAGVDRGEVSTVRYRAIDAALDDVATELAAAQQRAAAAKAAADKEAAEAEPVATQQPTVKKAVVEETTAPPKSEPAPPPEPKKAKEPVKTEPDKVGGEKGKHKPGPEKGKGPGK
ncbi:hypothetical protein KIN34_14730 [Cellulomonas sp. DKR-3]|uniref:Mucin-associated surface protein n=1 Tax=Cellulomonas fulva TaxID=2835530 RepID=A0ABS5U2B9_9CELL|nr:hypothetical protein [Cellulomonas fulva]MBT0995537.1 hypothetical protein [Cellulomonas fulva]